MQEAPINKMQVKGENKALPTQEFLYPEHGIVIVAESKEEADKKLQEIIKNK